MKTPRPGKWALVVWTVCMAGFVTARVHADALSVPPGDTQTWQAAALPDNTGITVTNQSTIETLELTVENTTEPLTGTVPPGYQLLDLSADDMVPVLNVARAGTRPMILRVRMEYDPARLRRKAIRRTDLVLLKRHKGGLRWRPMGDVMRLRGLRARRRIGAPIRTLGYYGVDTNDTYVWAVLDVPGTYAIGVMPEPASLLCCAAGVGLLVLRRRNTA